MWNVNICNQNAGFSKIRFYRWKFQIPGPDYKSNKLLGMECWHVLEKARLKPKADLEAPYYPFL